MKSNVMTKVAAVRVISQRQCRATHHDIIKFIITEVHAVVARFILPSHNTTSSQPSNLSHPFYYAMWHDVYLSVTSQQNIVTGSSLWHRCYTQLILCLDGREFSCLSCPTLA